MKRILKSQLESGTPFMFYRDEVNRANSNIQSGLIYCSNLCTEITQNQSPTEFLEEYVEADQTIVKKYKSGDYVVCKDRKSTRLNSSHVSISYAVFCLKKKN